MLFKKIRCFLKREPILCVSFVLAACSCLFVAPDAQYLAYFDLRTLILLFSLMTIVAGLQSLGIFERLARRLMANVRTRRQVYFILVGLCFFSSMAVTNDVALITFVPFGLMVLKMLRMDDEALPLVAYQTVAANLGSMLTPIGNPQNLYLYSISGMAAGRFMRLMLPLTLLSALALAALLLCRKDAPVGVSEELPPAAPQPGRRGRLALYLLLFAMSILVVLRVLQPRFLFPCVLLCVLIADRQTLLRVDYALLATFACFFVFIGNVGRIAAVRAALQAILAGREMAVAFFTSQAISNVPAALLLAGFTKRLDALLYGVNIGGLGTLIASLASLISYKYFARAYPAKKGRYVAFFTILNVCLAAVLLAAGHLLLSFSG